MNEMPTIENPYSFSNIIGIIGILIFLPLLASPIPTIYNGLTHSDNLNINNQTNSLNLSLEYFITALINCTLWAIYGVKTEAYPIYTSPKTTRC